MTDPSVLGDAKDLGIKVIPDKSNKTLTIHDNGIGMTKDELVKNLGTIAHSGTRAFMESLQSSTSKTSDSSLSLIGQFGVGFYSAYLVANTVTVVSKHNEEDSGYIWESNASGTFTVTKDDSGLIQGRGTKIILHLKDDLQEYLEEAKITEIIKKHSQYCPFPINLYVEREEEDQPDENPDENENVIDGKIEDDVPKKESKVLKKEYKVINKQQPIWVRNPEDVTKDEYVSFYKSLTDDWDEYMQMKHFSVDGQIQFKSLLYIPKKAPFDLFQKDNKKDNIKLYVKKVLITSDNAGDMLPEYLGFVKGIVDSEDMPLNVSREMLQQTSLMKVIKKNLTKQCIDMISDLANTDNEKFDTFYEAFGKNLKLGVHEDSHNRNKLVELLRFPSSAKDKTSLKDYVSRMKEGQNAIYYISAENIKVAKASPFIEKLVKMNFEVLFLVDPIDEYMIQTMKEYGDKLLSCCSKDGLSEISGDISDEDTQKWANVCSLMKESLKSKVIDVKLTNRLSTNPCVLVSDQYGWTANMERIMKAQALSTNNDMHNSMYSRRILEINPNHRILIDIKERIDDNKNVQNIINILYETVLVDSGFSLEEPSKYAQSIYRLISNGLSGEDTNDIKNEDESVVEEVESSMEDVD